MSNVKVGCCMSNVNLLTVAEAETKICFQSMYHGLCVGDKCMAWQWAENNTVYKQSSDEKPWPPAGYVLGGDGDNKAVRMPCKGFCAILGRG